MKQSGAKARIDVLRAQIEEHNNRYYVLNQPAISDFEYDILLNELDILEKKFPEFASDDSPTRLVGRDMKKEYKQVEQTYPMLSLGNTYNEDEIREFDNRVRKTCLLYTSPSPRDRTRSRMPSSA